MTVWTCDHHYYVPGHQPKACHVSADRFYLIRFRGVLESTFHARCFMHEINVVEGAESLEEITREEADVRSVMVR